MSRSRTILLSCFLGVSAAIVTANVAFADGRGFDGFGRRRDGGFMFFPMLLLIGLVALLIVLWRNRHVTAPVTTPVAAPPSSPTLNAQAILADRLARGEISPDDYRAAVAVLRETPTPLG
jgi:uncharacterized membrane protein